MDVQARNKEVIGQAFDLIHSIHKNQDYLQMMLGFHLGGPICIPDCGVCCCQSITTTEISAHYIASNIRRSLDQTKQDEITGRLRRWLLFSLPGVRLNFSDDGSEEMDIRHREGDLVGNLWCPFLGDSKGCLIYPWRDPTCRAWGISRPVARLCRRPYYSGESPETRCFFEDNHEIRQIQRDAAQLKGLLTEYVPGMLKKGWLPTLLYRILKPQEWAEIKLEVQETKDAQYESPLMWLLTEQEVKQYVKDEDILANSISWS